MKMILTAAIAGVATFSSLAHGQSATQSTKPADRPTDTPQVSSPYWNPQGAAYPDAGSQYGERLMEKTVLAVPQARADATVAQWQYRRLNNHLNMSADGMRRDFNQSDEYTAALEDFKKAYRDLDNARLDTLKGMRSSADYAAIESLRKQVSDQIADEREQIDPSLDRLVALAQLKMQSIAPVRVAEQDAIENSRTVSYARGRLIESAKKVAKLEREFAHNVRDSIDLAEARKAKEDARIAMLASSAYLDEIRLARDIAVRYSFGSRGLDQTYGNGVSSGYGYNGFGSYGGGFGGGYAFGDVNYGGFGSIGVGPVGGFGGSGFGSGSNAFVGPGAGRNDGGPITRIRPGNNDFNPFPGNRTYNPFGPSAGFFHPAMNGNGISTGGNAVGNTGGGAYGGNAFTGPTGGR